MPANSLPDLLVLGSINQDIVAVVPRLPAPGETIGGGLLSVFAGGKGANQAVAAARLGSQTRIVSAVGDDDAGRRIRGELLAAGVDTSLVTVADAATGTALIVVDEDGENQIAVCPGANAKIDVDPADITAAPVILTQLEVPLDVIIKAARAATGYFALNAAPAQRLPSELIECCDLIIVNETEYAEMPELASARLVAVTYGGDGAALIEKNVEILRVPAKKATVVNSVGAGDSFCAALTLGLAAGFPRATALSVATAVGADAVSHAASQPPLQQWQAYEDNLAAHQA